MNNPSTSDSELHGNLIKPNTMPEFEENNQINKADDKYTPSTDAKPRSRRRSGGFKSDYATNTSLNIGEVDPSLALKEDTLKKARSNFS